VNKSAESSIQHTLDTWQQQGKDTQNPVLFTLIQRMANRTELLRDGEPKRLLERRLHDLIQRYGNELNTPHDDEPLVSSPRPSALATLVSTLNSPANADDPYASPLRPHYPELPLLDEFRSVLSRTRAVRQVMQSEEQVHQNAGPLNSNHLVHRTLAMMRDVSPTYLHQFLGYLDALSWMEQLHATQEAAAKETKRSNAKSTKRPASKTKKSSPKTEKPSEPT